MHNPDESVGDETRAFQAFYLGEQKPAPKRSLLYRLLVGWWRR